MGWAHIREDLPVCFTNSARAHGVGVSHLLRMQKAVGCDPTVSTLSHCSQGYCHVQSPANTPRHATGHGIGAVGGPIPRTAPPPPPPSPHTRTRATTVTTVTAHHYYHHHRHRHSHHHRRHHHSADTPDHRTTCGASAHRQPAQPAWVNTSDSHAEGRGFKSHCVHSFSLQSRLLSCSVTC